jgi:hypothetical protein
MRSRRLDGTRYIEKYYRDRISMLFQIPLQKKGAVLKIAHEFARGPFS